MVVPPFVEVHNGLWLMHGDNSANTEAIRRTGNLNCDPIFQNVPELAALPKGGLFVDVGAFVGDTAAAFLNYGLRVAAFEPYPDAFLCLTHNLGGKAELFNFPVGNRKFVRMQTQEGGCMGGRGVWASDVQQPGIGYEPTASVRAWRLDDINFGEPVVGMKIDVEGYEPEVLAGAVETMKSCRVVIVEYNEPALKRKGYTVRDEEQFFAGWNAREIYRYASGPWWDVLYWR